MRFELIWIAPLPPQSSASTNFATTAKIFPSCMTAEPSALALAGVVGFEPTNGGFRIRCLNRTWRYPSTWCGRRDSNSHGSHHSHLKAARLPISPRPLALEKNYCLPRVIPSQPGKNTGTGCKAANINAEPGWIASHPSQQALRSRLQREPASSVRSSPYRARRLDAADSAC